MALIRYLYLCCTLTFIMEDSNVITLLLLSFTSRLKPKSIFWWHNSFLCWSQSANKSDLLLRLNRTHARLRLSFVPIGWQPALNSFSLVWGLSSSFKWPAIDKLLSYFEHLKEHLWALWASSLLCGSFHTPSRNLNLKSTCHTLCTSMASLQCGLMCVSK